MIAALPINQLAGRGHNSAAAPLAEVLREELAADKARADELLASAREARIESAADAGKVADLIALIRGQERDVDSARDARKRPLMADCRVIDAAYGNISGPMARARLDTLQPMLDAWKQAHPDEMIAASVAAVGARRAVEWVIEDLPAVVGWLLLEHGGPLAQAARTIIGSVVRAAGVDAVERGEIAIPGVSVSVQTKTQVR